MKQKHRKTIVKEFTESYQNFMVFWWFKSQTERKNVRNNNLLSIISIMMLSYKTKIMFTILTIFGDFSFPIIQLVGGALFPIKLFGWLSSVLGFFIIFCANVFSWNIEFQCVKNWRFYIRIVRRVKLRNRIVEHFMIKFYLPEWTFWYERRLFDWVIRSFVVICTG